MKTKPKILGVFLVTCLVLGLAAVAYAAFPDVSGHWAQSQIEKWVEQGLAKGYPDGTFRPDNNVTRAEFVALLNRAFGQQKPGAECAFADVKPADWYYAEVAAAFEAGYVRGYEDNTFRPNNPISRVEAAAIIARVLKLPAGDQAGLGAFSDAQAIPGWAQGNLAALVERKLVGGYPDGTFKPGNPITRAESVVLTDRALAYSKGVVRVTGVKLDKTDVVIDVGSTIQLTATVEPADATNKNVTWSSSDESIATVDQTGKVKGIKEGKATVTVTTEDGNFTATCAVTVRRISGGGGGGGGGGGVTVVPVTGVSLDRATLTLTVGASAQLAATVSPENATNKNVTWSSDNPAVATVDATGKVTAVAPGTATITVATVDGNKTASCVVTVTAALPVEIESYTTLSDPLGNTVVVVTIRPEYAEKVASVTVKGQTMNRRPGTNDWQKTLEGTVTVGDADFAVTLKPTVDVIEKADAALGLFGDTNVYVWLKSGVTATAVTANGTPMTYGDGKYTVTLWNLGVGDKVTVEVVTSEGFQTTEVVVRQL